MHPLYIEFGINASMMTDDDSNLSNLPVSRRPLKDFNPQPNPLLGRDDADDPRYNNLYLIGCSTS